MSHPLLAAVQSALGPREFQDNAHLLAQATVGRWGPTMLASHGTSAAVLRHSDNCRHTPDESIRLADSGQAGSFSYVPRWT